MSSSEFENRWQSENYKNYLKVIDALLYLRDGLGSFSKHVISEFQSEIISKLKITPKECKRDTCRAKNIKKGKLESECSDLCCALLVEILKEHSNHSDVHWSNSKINKWSVDAWEIAKVYMGKGQKEHNSGPQKSDPAAILQLLSICKRYRKYTKVADVTRVGNKRNEAMHSSTFSFTRDQMQEALTTMMDLLKKILQNMSAEKVCDSIKKELEKTLETLKGLMNTEFEIFLKNNEKTPHEEETKIFQEIINDHENRLNGLEELTEKVKEIKVVIPLLEMIQRNPDLMAKLADGYENLISLSQLEKRTLAVTELAEATASRVTDVEEDVADLRNQLEALALKSPDKNRSQVKNYKGDLKNLLDSKRISVPAKYSQKPDPASNNKWLASVTVILGSDTKTFESPASCQRIIDAEHSAASVAYQYLTEHEELFSASDKPMTDTGPKEELDKILVSFGFAKASYNDCDEKPVGRVKNFTASVTMDVTGIIQKKLDDVNMKQSERMQAVAVEALKAVGQEVTDTAKNTLYGWCGRNQFTLPKYYPDPPVEMMSYMHVISSAFTQKNKVEVLGNWQPSKKEAKRNAAELLLKIIRDYKLIDIWKSSSESTGDSASKAAVKPSQSPDTKCNEAKAEAKLEAKVEAKAEAKSEEKVEAKAEAKVEATAEAKAEAKALENNKAVPTMLDSLLYCDELKSLCDKLGLSPPEYKIVPTKENQFQANVTMEYIFGPDDSKQSTNKADAENEAARIALSVLMTDKASEPGGKKFKSLLNEFCQKSKSNVPEYINNGSGTAFHSKVKVKFTESSSEAFQSESEARDLSAKKVLLKLGQIKNYFEILKKYCDEFKLEEPEVKYNSRSTGGVESFCAVLDGVCVIASEMPSQSKKDAEKNAACRALKVLYPDVDCSDLNKCKNLLQEKTPSNVPKYDPETLANGQFASKVTVLFKMEGRNWHSNKEDALNEVAKEFLAKSTTSSSD